MDSRPAFATAMLPVGLLLLLGSAPLCVLGGDALLVGAVSLFLRSPDDEAFIVGGVILVAGVVVGLAGYRLYRLSVGIRSRYNGPADSTGTEAKSWRR
jgi:hypothetical protein